MLEEIYQLAYTNWIWLILGTLLVGMEKAGIKGLSMAVVAIFALILGGKNSSGLLLLLFMLADLMAVRYYYRFAQRTILIRLLFPAFLGVVAGALLGNYIDELVFKNIIAIVVFTCLGLMLWPGFYRYVDQNNNQLGLAIIIGFLTGFSTMIANVSSPILAVYLLALQLPKKQFIGTVVWFFFIINFMKLPFHIWSWQTIDLSVLQTALLATPILIIGFLIGLYIIKRIPEKAFRYLIIGVTFLAALKLLWSN